MSLVQFSNVQPSKQMHPPVVMSQDTVFVVEHGQLSRQSFPNVTLLQSLQEPPSSFMLSGQ
uniref:Uncharacterized protein n=1 Tax=Arion vulgaris TaxID=1028688 RepID=A0A0B7BT26_9EUPU